MNKLETSTLSIYNLVGGRGKVLQKSTAQCGQLRTQRGSLGGVGNPPPPPTHQAQPQGIGSVLAGQGLGSRCTVRIQGIPGRSPRRGPCSSSSREVSSAGSWSREKNPGALAGGLPPGGTEGQSGFPQEDIPSSELHWRW